MLAKEVAEALLAEVEFLEVQKKRIEARIANLRAVLIPEDDLFQRSLPGLQKEAVAAVAGQGQVAGNGSFASKGLREAMRIVLSSYPSGVKPKDLAAKLEAMGWRPKGKMSARSLMYAEIYRMAKHGLLVRRSHKVMLPIGKEASQT